MIETTEDFPVSYELVFVALCGGGLFGAWPYLRRTTADMRAACCIEGQEARDKRVMAAIAADDVATVAGVLTGATTLPNGAWAAAVERAHPDMVGLLLPLADPCASLDRSEHGISAVSRMAAVIHTGGRDDYGVAALRLVLDDPRVTVTAVSEALEMWRLSWARSVGGTAERLDALLDHPSLSVQVLANDPERLEALERLEHAVLSGKPSACGQVVERHLAIRINRRAAEARALAKADAAKIIPFRRSGRL